MADFQKMIPFIFHFAAGVYGKNGSDLRLPLEKQFNIARERGWSDDNDDPGGATMIDVTLTTFKFFRKCRALPEPDKEDLRNISLDEWTDILKSLFWNRWRADEIKSQGIANILVDWIWASGAKSIKDAQKIIGVVPDGIVGVKTISAINQADPDSLFGRLRYARTEYYKHCKAAWKYLPGWIRRLEAIQPDGSFKIYSTTI